MYLSHFGLDEPPFRITSNTDFFFEGANRGATLEGLLYAITHDEGIVKVVGEVGSGKTMLCRVMINRLPKNVETVFLSNPSLSREEILRAIAEDLRIEIKSRRTTLLLRALQEHLIRRYAEGGRVVILIDEAHAMPSESLEEIRLLSNLESSRHKLLQIVLFGQPELDEYLDQTHMRQLKERITHAFKLEPMVRADIESYVDFRMRAAGFRGEHSFSKPALKLICIVSQGLTRRINILCDKSLLAAFADNELRVQLKHARAAVKDSEFRRFSKSVKGWWLAAGGLGVGLVLGIAIQFAPTVLGKTGEGRTTALANMGRSSDGSSALNTVLERPTAPTPIEATRDKVTEGNAPGAGQHATARRSDGPPPLQPANDAIPPTAELKATDPLLPPHRAVQERRDGRSALTNARVAATQQWLQSTPAERYSIQLLTATETDLAWMESFLRKAVDLVDPEAVYVYSWKIDGRLNYRIAYGTYVSLQQSLSAIAALPGPLQAYKPYPESVAVMRQLTARQ